MDSAERPGDGGADPTAADDDAIAGPKSDNDDARVAGQTAGAGIARTGDRGVDPGTDDRDATTRSTGERAAPSQPGEPRPIDAPLGDEAIPARPPVATSEGPVPGLVSPPPMVSRSALAVQDALRADRLLSGPLLVAVPAGLLLGLLLVGLGVVAVRLTRPTELPDD